MPDVEEIKSMLADYYRAFSTLDPAKAAQFFLEPATFMGPPGAHCLPDHSAVTNVLDTVMKRLQAQGYGGSELGIRDIQGLGDHVALVNGLATRRKADGTELERVPIAYIVHKSDAGWRIAALILQS